MAEHQDNSLTSRAETSYSAAVQPVSPKDTPLPKVRKLVKRAKTAKRHLNTAAELFALRLADYLPDCNLSSDAIKALVDAEGPQVGAMLDLTAHEPFKRAGAGLAADLAGDRRAAECVAELAATYGISETLARAFFAKIYLAGLRPGSLLDGASFIGEAAKAQLAMQLRELYA